MPHDYFELQRHFCALYPRHDAPMTVEREGERKVDELGNCQIVPGATVPPWETNFMNGEVIIFREYTLPKKNVERERGEYDWEKEYADKATIMRDCWERPEKARGW